MGATPRDRAPPVIELQGITKRFGPVEVLTNVDLSLYAGQVHSLAGENGAGKSTLVKILGGDPSIGQRADSEGRHRDYDPRTLAISVAA